jgi:hypothetical protein
MSRLAESARVGDECWVGGAGMIGQEVGQVWQQGFLFSTEPLPSAYPVVRPKRRSRRAGVAADGAKGTAAGVVREKGIWLSGPGGGEGGGQPAACSSAIGDGVVGVGGVVDPGAEGVSASGGLDRREGPSRREGLERLRGMVRRMERRGVEGEDGGAVLFSAGGEVLDRMLPHGGLRPGTLIEWVGGAHGEGAWLLATMAAASWLAHPASGDRPLVIADGWAGDESFYPPGAIALGIPAGRMVIFRKGAKQTSADLIWAMDQALRSGTVAGVLAEVSDRVGPADARRLQLAAEAGGAVLFWVRSKVGRGVRGTKGTKLVSVADVRWDVSPLAGPGGRRLRVDVVRCRGGVAGESRVIEIEPRPGGVLKGGGAGGAVRVRDLTPAGGEVARRGGVSGLSEVASSEAGDRDERAKVVSDLARRLAGPASHRRGGGDGVGGARKRRTG